MGVVKGAVGCAAAALLAAQALSGLEPSRRAALWDAARAALGAAPRLAAPPAAAPPVPRPPAAALAPSPALGEEEVPADRYGQFQATVEIEGQRLPVLVDTGATFVALRAEDADRLGIHPMPSDFRYVTSTANGRAAVARVELRSVRLGGIEVRDVTALVSGRGQLSTSLLGMSFLSRLSGVRVDHGRLILAR